jgi:hypothetical protein
VPVVDAVCTKTIELARFCADDLDEAAEDLKLRDVASATQDDQIPPPTA